MKFETTFWTVTVVTFVVGLIGVMLSHYFYEDQGKTIFLITMWSGAGIMWVGMLIYDLPRWWKKRKK